MQKLYRNKKYKACEPLETICKVRDTLTGLDLFTIESHHIYPMPDVSSCRVCLGDPELFNLNIGTNGKGMTPRYSLASAYAEFMERIQNNVLFPIRQLEYATSRYLENNNNMNSFKNRLSRENLTLDFQYAPDEVYLDIDMLINECADVLLQAFHLDNENKLSDYLHEVYGNEQIPCVPFYSVNQKCTRLLPVKILWNICGSNGMCAGNTAREAIIQGTSELFERYVIQCIYQFELTPPTVPLAFFEGTPVYERLQSLMKSGFNVKIKDCSLGKGFPVIGLLLQNNLDGKYAFHIGSDPSPITALERCLTEMFQGSPSDNKMRFHEYSGLKLPDSENTSQWSNYYNEYFKTIQSGTGEWPDSIFKEDASYPFYEFEHPVTYEDASDLSYLLDFANKRGCMLFIRDKTYLDFPAFQVYIPGISEIDYLFFNNHMDFEIWTNVAKYNTIMLNLPNASVEDIAKLAEAILKTEKTSVPTLFTVASWFLSNDYLPLLKVDNKLFKALICGIYGMYIQASESMKAYLDTEDSNSKPRLFYKALSEFWQLLADGRSIEGACVEMASQFGEGIVERCKKSIDEPGVLFDKDNWPTCFDCDSCKITKNCRYFDVLRIIKRLQDCYVKNLPNQEVLLSLLA